MLFFAFHILALNGWRLCAFFIGLGLAQGTSLAVSEFTDMPIVDAIIHGSITFLIPNGWRVVLMAGLLRAMAFLTRHSPEYFTFVEIKSKITEIFNEFENKEAEEKRRRYG